MKLNRKWMLVIALMLSVATAISGTLAYLTDHASVTNRFTIGNVDIVVDETEVDVNGKPVPNPDYDPTDPDETDVPKLRTEAENEYPLIPASEYIKDPTMTVKAGSKESYVRMMVTLSSAAEIDTIFTDLKAKYPAVYPNGFVPGVFVTGHDSEAWVYVGTMVKDEALNTYTLEFRYFETVEPAASEDLVLPPLFETIKIPGELTNMHLTQLESFSIDVKGHAIQATGFNTADEAWAAFDAQMNIANSGTEFESPVFESGSDAASGSENP